jgi:hypothetical protein
MNLYYTGVGSREAPEQVLQEFRSLAYVLALAGYTLRSGGADGADIAFEEGARRAPNAKLEIFLPWKGFKGNKSRLVGAGPNALALATTVHPAWSRLEDGPRKLHGRNCYQVLGKRLDSPSAFLVCWTSDGCEEEHTRSSNTGGTATAIVLACRHRVPVFNFARDGRRAALNEFLAQRGVVLPKGTLQADQAPLF